MLQPLKHITTLQDFNEFMEHISPLIGTHGGRRFIIKNGTVKGEKRSYSMNEIVYQFKKCVIPFLKNTQNLDPITIQLIQKGMRLIETTEEKACAALLAATSHQ